MRTSGSAFQLALLAGAAAVAAVFNPGSALAQEAGARVELETIVVTARKQTERLMDVPVSANVMSAQMLQRYATSDLTAVAAQLPQVSITPTTAGPGAIIAIRGVGSSGTDAGVNQEVTVNIDGVPISRGRIIKHAMFDLGSVEVLKGPQVLYFGKNSPAGVITLNSENPGPEFSGYAKVGHEFRADEWIAEAAANLPINDALRARVSFRASDMQGGYVKNIGGPITDPSLLQPALRAAGLTLPGGPDNAYPGSKSYAGRLTLLYRPNSSFDATFRILGGMHEESLATGTSVVWSCGPGQTNVMTTNILAPGTFFVDPYAPCNGKGLELRGNSYGIAPAPVLESFLNTDSAKPFYEAPSILSSLTMNFSPIDSVKLTSVTGYYKSNTKFLADNSFSSLTMAPSYSADFYRQFTQEFRIQTSFDGPINFTGGLFYEDSKRGFQVESLIAYVGADPVTGRWSLFASDDHYTTKAHSAFGELRWQIAPNLELAGGARYTKEKQTGDINQFYGRVVTAPKRVIGEFTDDNISPQATLTWHPAKDVMLYAAYKEGFKAGGFSSPAIVPATGTPQNQSFKAEAVKGYEVGAKFTALDNRLAGDITAYHYEFSELQLSAFNAQAIAFFIQNAGEALQKGVEANLRFKATRDLDLNASVGHNKSRFTSFPNSQCWAFQTAGEGCVGGVQNLGGRPLALAPNWVATAGAAYSHPLTNDIDMNLSADVKYSSGYYLQFNLNPWSQQGAFYTINASARFIRKDWELAFIARNLTDEYYAVYGQDKTLGPRGQTVGYLGAPRTFQVEVMRRF